MRHYGWALAVMMSALAAGGAAAQTESEDTAHSAPSGSLRPADDDPMRRWSVHVDDDLFSFANRDRDYTGGVSFGLTGSRAHDHPLSLAGVLERVDRATGVAARRGDAAIQGE